MGTIQVSHVEWRRPGGATLLDDVSFHVGDGERVALVGANGVGKTTVLRLLSGELRPTSGTITVEGHVGVMHQLVGMTGDAATVRGLLTSLAPARIRAAAEELAAAHEAAGVGRSGADPPGTDATEGDPVDPMRYAHALTAWGEAGGYDIEVFWDACCTRAIGLPFAGPTGIGDRPLSTLSGGEQKKLALEALLRGDEFDVLVLDEPDNFLDVPAKRWLEDELRRCTKTVLYVSHDRELLAATATKIVTIEAHGAWTHGGGFAGYHDARLANLAKREKDIALFEDERARLEGIVAEMRRRAKISDTFAPRLKAAESRLRQFLAANEAPPRVREQKIDVRIRGGRTGKKALTIEALELHGLTEPFAAEIWFGERVAVLGANGAGKSHFLRLLAGDGGVAHGGSVKLGAGVVAGHFSQTHEHPEWVGRTLLEILERHDVVRGPAMAMLRRYEIQGCAGQTFETLSGGQQARFQVLLLELAGATLLLLDEPTDNLDLVSAEALEAGLTQFTGTVLAVTHDRWFLRGFERFIVFGADCTVTDHLEVPPAFR